MAEKRIVNRKRKRLKIRFGVEHPKRIAFTDDASDKGLFITTAMPEKPGTIVMIEIETPGGETVKCQGQVRWARKVPSNMLRHASKGGMGVRLGNFTQGKEVYLQMVEQLRF
jgi:hypothetical protein